jgi:hypothetical protein
MARYLQQQDIRRYVIGGMPSKEGGELGFLNFKFVPVPDGSGIFMNGNINRAVHGKALEEFYGY